MEDIVKEAKYWWVYELCATVTINEAISGKDLCHHPWCITSTILLGWFEWVFSCNYSRGFGNISRCD